MEESREADTAAGKATHRIAHGIGNKVLVIHKPDIWLSEYTDNMIGAIILLLQGHALTRKLDCDGKVNTMQTLQNLNEGSTVLVPSVTSTLIIVCQAV